MPINLTQLEEQVANGPVLKSYSPKFFHNKLTGSGNKNAIGVLSSRNTPMTVPDSRPCVSNNYTHSKRTFTQGLTTTTNIPLSPLRANVRNYLKTWKDKDAASYLPIAEIKLSGGATKKIYLNMRLVNVFISETQTTSQTGGVTYDKQYFMTYRCDFYIINDPNSDVFEYQTKLTSLRNILRQTNNVLISIYTDNPKVDFLDDTNHQHIGYDLHSGVQYYSGSIDMKAIENYLNDYDLYDDAEQSSMEWQEVGYLDDYIEQLTDNLKSRMLNSGGRMEIETFKNQLHYLMSYNIPLDVYRSIYTKLAAAFGTNPKLLRELTKTNLNLMLSDTIENLNQLKPQIPIFNPPNPTKPLPASMARLSKEQKNAVTSREPLILVQSGAGTGKSTLILARIDYLIASGIQPQDITVISFTNAAADHIKEKNANVNSMTFAAMINEIYTTNFRGHELSSIDTILNSLEIYFPIEMANPSSLVSQFYRVLKLLNTNDITGYTNANTFVEENYDDVIKILDTIGQTSLELQVIIAYLKIDTFIEPPTVASKYLIIDEVQDNSIFEFVYTLKYIDKHKENLFIVGRL